MNISIVHPTENVLTALGTLQEDTKTTATGDISLTETVRFNDQAEPQTAVDTDSAPAEALQTDLRQLQIQRQITAAEPADNEAQTAAAQQTSPSAEDGPAEETTLEESTAAVQESYQEQKIEESIIQDIQNATRQAYQDANQTQASQLNIVG